VQANDLAFAAMQAESAGAPASGNSVKVHRTNHKPANAPSGLIGGQSAVSQPIPALAVGPMLHSRKAKVLLLHHQIHRSRLGLGPAAHSPAQRRQYVAWVHGADSRNARRGC
jgi:hypothetical protein